MAEFEVEETDQQVRVALPHRTGRSRSMCWYT
jgi:hypothetical protein